MTKYFTGAIPCPKNDAEAPRFLRAVGRHVDVLEYRIRLAGLLAEVQARHLKDVTEWSNLRHASQPHLSEQRRKLHKKILNRLFVEDSRCYGARKPIAVILLGPLSTPVSGRFRMCEPPANRPGLMK